MLDADLCLPGTCLSNQNSAWQYSDIDGQPDEGQAVCWPEKGANAIRKCQPLLCIGSAEPGKANSYACSPVSVRPEPGSKKRWPHYTLVSLLTSQSSMGGVA